MKMQIKWKLGGVTEVLQVKGVFEESNSALADVFRSIASSPDARVFLVADGNVVSRTEGLGSKIGRYLQTYSIALAGQPAVVSAGEKAKMEDFFAFKKTLAAAMEARLGANDVLIAIGGGSLFDVAGLVAAQVGGGMKYIKIPTTVPAMVDAAFAERALFNFGNIKDAFGVHAPANAVIIDSSFAPTVLDGVWRAGFAEILRIGVATDSKLVNKVISSINSIKSRSKDVLEDLIASAVKLRVKSGPINFGLWCAERLESMSAYKLPHGYAVAIGTAISIRYAALRGNISSEDAESVVSALGEIGALDSLEHSQHLMAQAQKVVDGLNLWRLSHLGGIESISSIGKRIYEDEVDSALMAQAVSSFLINRTA